LTTYNCLDRRN